MRRLVSVIVLFGRQRMALNETHYYFLSDYDTMHQLSVGGICPGETVISCLDDPDEEPMSFSNFGSESVTAFFIVDAYSNAVGPFTLQWNLKLYACDQVTDLGKLTSPYESTNEFGSNNIALDCGGSGLEKIFSIEVPAGAELEIWQSEK